MQTITVQEAQSHLAEIIEKLAPGPLDPIPAQTGNPGIS